MIEWAFILSFFCLLSIKYVLSVNYMPGTVLGTNVIAINKTDKFPAVLEHTL